MEGALAAGSHRDGVESALCNTCLLPSRGGLATLHVKQEAQNIVRLGKLLDSTTKI